VGACETRLAVEIGDWTRLSPVTIGSYLGVVPAEDSTGEKRSQHGVTKTGNSHVRRLLIEAAWHHRPPYRPSTKLQRRWQRAPGAVAAHAGKGNRRLHARWRSFDTRRKRPVVASTAIARELAAGVRRWRSWIPVADRLPGPRRRQALRNRGQGQPRSCSLRCACSTLTLTTFPKQTPLSQHRRTGPTLVR
jgi:hypothetical protein